jgi:hypothetical protein
VCVYYVCVWHESSMHYVGGLVIMLLKPHAVALLSFSVLHTQKSDAYNKAYSHNC